MTVTQIRITVPEPSPRNPRLMAYARITIDDAMAIHGVALIRGDAGPMLAMPSRARHDGSRADLVHPITPAVREELTRLVLAA